MYARRSRGNFDVSSFRGWLECVGALCHSLPVLWFVEHVTGFSVVFFRWKQDVRPCPTVNQRRRTGGFGSCAAVTAPRFRHSSPDLLTPESLDLESSPGSTSHFSSDLALLHGPFDLAGDLGLRKGLPLRGVARCVYFRLWAFSLSGPQVAAGLLPIPDTETESKQGRIPPRLVRNPKHRHFL